MGRREGRRVEGRGREGRGGEGRAVRLVKWRRERERSANGVQNE